MKKGQLVFQPARRKRLSSQVAEQIEKLITAKQLNPGDLLPPEREISSQMEVSRPVVREGLQRLETLGLIRKDRSGIWICELDIKSYLQSTVNAANLLIGVDDELRRQVWQMRYVLEVEIAAIAAKEASPKDIAQLRRIVQEQSKILDDAKKYGETSFEFHQYLAEMTRNKIFLFIISSLREVLSRYFYRTLTVPGESRDSHAYHQEILQAVESGSAERARKAMYEHLKSTEKIHNELAQKELITKQKESKSRLEVIRPRRQG